jgi:hypothetical protein
VLCLSGTNILHGGDSLEDDEHTCWPRTVRTELKIQEVATLVRANHSQTVDEIAAAAAAGISHGTCHGILSDDLNMYCVTQHSIPHVLTQDQRNDRLSICSDLIDSADKDGTFLNRIITCLNCFSTRLELFTWNSSQKEILRRLGSSVRRKRPELWRRKN